MKLDRNLNGDGRGKYGIIRTRRLQELIAAAPPAAAEAIERAIASLEEHGILDWGKAGSENEFFVLKLKDRFSRPALESYAGAVDAFPGGDVEYAADIYELAARAGKHHPACKTPD